MARHQRKEDSMTKKGGLHDSLYSLTSTRWAAVRPAPGDHVREDIAKVVVERPRRGGGNPESKAYKRHIDWKRLREEGREGDSPGRECIRGLKWGFNKKEFSDFLTPIVGFLRKNSGRPWDDVWSEISAFLKPSSTTQRHILGHVNDYVEKNVIIHEDGEITDSKGRGFYRRYAQFYVDPNDGILREWKPKVELPTKEEEKPWRTGALGPDFPYVQLRGEIWFEVSFSSLPILQEGWASRGKFFTDAEWATVQQTGDIFFYSTRAVITDTVIDVWFKRIVPSKVVTSFSLQRGKWSQSFLSNKLWNDGGLLYCSAKRQLNTAEKKRLGLR